jgi:hypothetical protein
MCVCLQSVLEGISRDAGFKSEVLKAQDMHHTTLNRESERLANDVSKVRAEIRWELWHWFMSDSFQRWRSILLNVAVPADQGVTVVGRYEVEKLTASQRLDLNLEKGRMRDELQVGNAGGLPGMMYLRPATIPAFV